MFCHYHCHSFCAVSTGFNITSKQSYSSLLMGSHSENCNTIAIIASKTQNTLIPISIEQNMQKRKRLSVRFIFNYVYGVFCSLFGWWLPFKNMWKVLGDEKKEPLSALVSIKTLEWWKGHQVNRKSFTRPNMCLHRKPWQLLDLSVQINHFYQVEILQTLHCKYFGVKLLLFSIFCKLSPPAYCC